MAANQHRGEVDLVLGGKNRVIKIDFTVMRSVEKHMGMPFNSALGQGYMSAISGAIYFGLKGNKGKNRLSINQVEEMMNGSSLVDYSKAVGDAYTLFMGEDPDAEDVDGDSSGSGAEGGDAGPFPKSSEGSAA